MIFVIISLYITLIQKPEMLSLQFGLFVCLIACIWNIANAWEYV